jgi:hypothetical protein
MRDCERKVELRRRLGAVNTEWRVLSREPRKRGSELARMEELRSERLVLMTALFEFERRDGQPEELDLLRRSA